MFTRMFSFKQRSKMSSYDTFPLIFSHSLYWCKVNKQPPFLGGGREHIRLLRTFLVFISVGNCKTFFQQKDFLSRLGYQGSQLGQVNFPLLADFQFLFSGGNCKTFCQFKDFLSSDNQRIENLVLRQANSAFWRKVQKFRFACKTIKRCAELKLWYDFWRELHNFLST